LESERKNEDKIKKERCYFLLRINAAIPSPTSNPANGTGEAVCVGTAVVATEVGVDVCVCTGVVPVCVGNAVVATVVGVVVTVETMDAESSLLPPPEDGGVTGTTLLAAAAAANVK